jgi:hypothetical protein
MKEKRYIVSPADLYIDGKKVGKTQIGTSVFPDKSIMGIYSLSGKFSVHKGTINLSINDVDYDISHLFPKHKYSQDELNNPEINWKVRVEMCQAIRDFVLSLDGDFPVDTIIC